MKRLAAYGLLALALLLLSTRCLPAAANPTEAADATLDAWLDAVQATATAPTPTSPLEATMVTARADVTRQSLEQRVTELEERVRQLEQSLQWMSDKSHSHGFGGYDGGYAGQGYAHDHSHPPDHTHYR